MKKITRVALITSGGDCQGLNAAMRGIGKALHNKVENLEIFGMYDGYRGLVDGDYKFMEPKDFAGILTQGGTILGTSRQRYIPGKDIVDENGNSLIPAMKDTYNRLNLDCLVIMGGNGTQKSAKLLMDAGMNVVTLPRPLITISGARIRRSASRAPSMLQLMSLTTSIPPLHRTAACSSLSLWAATQAGLRCTQASARARI